MWPRPVLCSHHPNQKGIKLCSHHPNQKGIKLFGFGLCTMAGASDNGHSETHNRPSPNIILKYLFETNHYNLPPWVLNLISIFKSRHLPSNPWHKKGYEVPQ